jgi:hypothetical protein
MRRWFMVRSVNGLKTVLDGAGMILMSHAKNTPTKHVLLRLRKQNNGAGSFIYHEFRHNRSGHSAVSVHCGDYKMNDAEKIRVWVSEPWGQDPDVYIPKLTSICRKLLDVVEMASKCRCGFSDGMITGCCSCALLLPRKAIQECAREIKERAE